MQHRLQPAEVHESLWNTYSARYLSRHPALFGRRIPAGAFPGRTEAAEIEEARAAIDSDVRKAERILFGPKKCGECHEYETAGRAAIPALERWDPARAVQTRATDVPEAWLTSAVFDHSAHRAVHCRECHDRAYLDNSRVSRQSSDVLLPSIDICLKCHSPRRPGSAGIDQLGGASFECTECHRYHNGDQPRQGWGASARDAKGKASVRDFLSGSP
jgi:hypothetical protein